MAIIHSTFCAFECVNWKMRTACPVAASTMTQSVFYCQHRQLKGIRKNDVFAIETAHVKLASYFASFLFNARGAYVCVSARQPTNNYHISLSYAAGHIIVIESIDPHSLELTSRRYLDSMHKAFVFIKHLNKYKLRNNNQQVETFFRIKYHSCQWAARHTHTKYPHASAHKHVSTVKIYSAHKLKTQSHSRPPTQNPSTQYNCYFSFSLVFISIWTATKYAWFISRIYYIDKICIDNNAVAAIY